MPKKVTPYVLITNMHNDKTVFKYADTYADLKMEIARQRKLKAFYRNALYLTRSPKKVVTIHYAR